MVTATRPPVINPAEFPNPHISRTERAWDVLHFIERNPQAWRQDSWGSWIKTRHLLTPWRTERHFAGCFATLLCLRTGYEVEEMQHVDIESVPHLRPYVGNFRYAHVSLVAADILGIGVPTADKLFAADHNLTELKELVSRIFGEDPFPLHER